MTDPIPTPKVFISYSWTNDEHVAWVIRLAERLVGDGVNVILDQWDLKEGHDKYVFMEQMVTDPTIKNVLAVCDEKYANKADGREGGVGTESQIISKDIYDKVSQEKFIPLIRERDGAGKEFTPVFFRNRKYIDFSNDNNFSESYEKLLRVIYGRPELRKPQLGQPPSHLFDTDTTHVKTAGKLERLKDAVTRGKPYVYTVLQEYLDVFVESMEDFRISYSRNDPTPFDDQVIASVMSFTPYRDNFIDFILFAAGYMNDQDSYDRIFEFLEQLLPFKDRPENVSNYYEESFDNYRFILYELFLYLIAALIKTKRYTAAAKSMHGEYTYPDSRSAGRYRKQGADAFNEYVRSLDEHRNNRLQLRRYSVVADIILERAKHPKISFKDLFQVDFLLFFTPYMVEEAPRPLWYPRCIGYSSRVGTLEILAKATSKQGFEMARHIMMAKNLADLSSKLHTALRNQQLTQVLQSERFMFTSLEGLLNLRDIQQQLQPKS